VPYALVSRCVWGYYAGRFAASSGLCGFFAVKPKNFAQQPLPLQSGVSPA
jgi:hypothetical protein